MERGLEVSEAEAAAYPFTYDDIHLCQILLRPDDQPKTHKTIADELGITESALKQRLLDPQRCAFISTQLNHAIQSQLGRVHASVYLAAIRTGDPARARYLDQLFGKGPRDGPQQLHVHNHNHIDLSGLTDEQLKQFIRDRQRKLTGVIDVEPEQK